jgi:hypothetical protein
MHKKVAHSVWVAASVLALAAMACSLGGAEATATPLPRPTQRPLATSTTAPALPTSTRAAPKTTPTEQPQPTDVPTDVATAVATDSGTSAAPFTLSSTPYKHKTGAFTITLPDGWKPEEGNNSVFAASPDKVSSIDITFTNVGSKFDAATLETLIKAEEANWFALNKDYKARPEEKQSDGSILIYKTFTLDDGTPETAFSYYWQDGTVVYEQDFWVDTDLYDQYAKSLVQVANTMKTDSAAGAKADPYAVVYTYTDPNNLFQFDVPYAWTHESSITSTSDVETFTSPDKLSYFENIAYDDGTTVSKSDAGQFALDLLKQYYKLTDLVVTNDQQQGDGSERLTWNSAQQGIDGESFFETRGTTFLLLTWVVDSSKADFFKPVWSALVDSYKVPQP